LNAKAGATVSAGLWIGLVAGVADAASVLVENPNSFAGASDVAAFATAAVAGSVALGGAGGMLLALLPRRPGSAIVAPVLALWLFAWVGVRVHVRWFFGTPLAEPRYLAVNVALLAAAAIAVTPLGLLLRRGRGTFVARPLVPALVGTAALAAWVVLGGPLGPSAPRPATAEPPPGARDVLLVTLDTTRADHLSAYGYPRGTTPFLDRLARRGTTWIDLSVPIPLTNPSHSSLFTGLLPREHGVRNNGTPLGAGHATFVEGLAAQGWSCAAFVSGIPLKAKLSGLARGFSVYDDRFSPLEAIHPMLTTLAVVRVANRVLPIDFVERRAARTARAAVAWLGASRGPRFVWVHFFDAHTPYDAAPVLRERFARESRAWSANGRDVTAWPFADYDAEVRAADRALGDVVRAFDEVTGGRGVIVVTADHGEGLEQHGELAHGAQLYTEDLRVPGVVRGAAAGPPGGLDRGLACLTRFARLVPAWAHGTVPDLVPPPGWTEAATYAPEGRHDQSAVWDDAGEKIMVNWDTGEERSFDLAADPGETSPRPPGEGSERLKGHLVPPGEAGSEELDPEVVRRLRALGYLH